MVITLKVFKKLDGHTKILTFRLELGILQMEAPRPYQIMGTPGIVMDLSVQSRSSTSERHSSNLLKKMLGTLLIVTESLEVIL